MALIQVGDQAPDFELPALIGGVKQRWRLSEHRAHNIVLAFHPFNWEPASTEQFTRYQVEREEFLACGAEIVGISVDSIMNTTSWERDIGPFDFALCSDFWPHGEVSGRYGVLRPHEPARGASERAIFIVDKAGAIAFRKVYALNNVPDMAEVFDWLRALRAA
jgi:peroxiredoxin (alkyl hydroperoxide reductase subunit C)